MRLLMKGDEIVDDDGTGEPFTYKPRDNVASGAHVQVGWSLVNEVPSNVEMLGKEGNNLYPLSSQLLNEIARKEAFSRRMFPESYPRIDYDLHRGVV